MNLKELGFYDKSYRLMMMPLGQITSVINPVLQPVLSTLQDNKGEIAIKYNKIINFIAAISFPLAIILFFSAKEIITIIYGYSWEPSIPAFKILALSLPLQMIQSTSGAILQSANATKEQFVIGIKNTITTVSGFFIGAYFFRTVEAIAWSWDITLMINFCRVYYTLYKKVLESSLKEMLYQLYHPTLFAIVGAFTYLIIEHIPANLILLVVIKGIVAIILLLFSIHKTDQVTYQK